MKAFLAAKAKAGAKGVVLTQAPVEKKEEVKKVEEPVEKDIIINAEYSFNIGAAAIIVSTWDEVTKDAKTAVYTKKDPKEEEKEPVSGAGIDFTTRRTFKSSTKSSIPSTASTATQETAPEVKPSFGRKDGPTKEFHKEESKNRENRDDRPPKKYQNDYKPREEGKFERGTNIKNETTTETTERKKSEIDDRKRETYFKKNVNNLLNAPKEVQQVHKTEKKIEPEQPKKKEEPKKVAQVNTKVAEFITIPAGWDSLDLKKK